MNSLLRFAVIIAVIGISYRLLRVYIAGGVCTSDARMTGKTVIITGANTGIGKATALDLARRGARVIMACRDLQRGQTALNDILQSTASSNVILKHLDLASMKSIRAFAQDINTNEANLHVLINNAGLVSTPQQRQETEDGFELTMGVNHLGHFLLTNLLLDLLKKSAPARVVVVSSYTHSGYIGTRAPFRFDNMQSKAFYENWETYGQSKLANILFTRELAKRLHGTGVTANSLHPGAVATEAGRHQGFSRLTRLGMTLIFKTVEEGAQTTIHLAVSEELKDSSGKYFIDCEETEPSKTAQDDLAANKLWHVSAELVGLPKTV